MSICNVNADDSPEHPLWIIANPEPYFSEPTERGKLSGYSIDLVSDILTRAGINRPFLQSQWERLEKEARSKPDVLAFALTRTKEREPYYHWITSITSNRWTVIARQNTRLPVATQLSDLSALSMIAVLQDDAREQIMREAGLQNIQRHKSWKSAIQALLRGEVSAIFFSNIGMQVVCQKNNLDCPKTDTLYEHKRTESYLILSKQGTSKTLAALLKKKALEYKASDEFKKMSQKWIDQYQQQLGLKFHMHNGTMFLWQKAAVNH